MALITPKNTWTVVTQASNAKKGPLVRVQMGPGRYVKMYEADAIAKGLIPGKAKPQATNKMQTSSKNKAAAPEAQTEEKAPADDFTTISGIGPATARALAAHGITTFDQLKAAEELAYLPAKARAGIDAWRAVNG